MAEIPKPFSKWFVISCHTKEFAGSIKLEPRNFIHIHDSKTITPEDFLPNFDGGRKNIWFTGRHKKK